MRTIVALFLASVAGAQSLAEIERLEKAIAAKPDSVPDRVALLNPLLNRLISVPPERVKETRRRTILWLIEHHPEAAIYDNPALALPAKGRLADPAGSAEAVALWKHIAAQPDVKAQVIANAAIYLRSIDIALARLLLEGLPDEPVLAKARGMVDVAALVGLSGLGQNNQFGTSASLRNPGGKAEIDASTNPNLLGSAGAELIRGRIELPFDLTFGDDDVVTLAERWLRRAGDEYKPQLGQALQNKANRMIDPTEKVRLLRESYALAAEGAKPGVMQTLVTAEFDAGDDAAAARDAALLLTAPKIPIAYNAAQMILGRIAAAKGDFVEAKARLQASVKMPDTIKNAVFQPNMALAQDVYESGDHEAVLQFLEASRAVWKFDRGRIDRMISFVKKAPSVDLQQLANQFPGNEIVRRPAPAFEAKDLDGKSWTREELAGKVVALEFGKAPLAEKVAKDFAPRGAILLQVQDADVKRRFEVLTDPTMIFIDRQGNVAAYHAGSATEPEWRTDFETAFGGGPNPTYLPPPKQVESNKGSVAWEPVPNAESYVVEWDVRDEKGWQFDQDHSVRVIATREASVMLDLEGFTRIRWRVYAVPRNGPAGKPSAWREIDGVPVTKIYK